MNEVQALKLAFAMTLTRIVGCPQAEAETLVEKMHEALRVKAAEKAFAPREVDEATAMKGGRWVSADDIERMAGELVSLATGDPFRPTKMVDAFHTLRAALTQPATTQRTENSC